VHLKNLKSSLGKKVVTNLIFMQKGVNGFQIFSVPRWNFTNTFLFHKDDFNAKYINDKILKKELFAVSYNKERLWYKIETS
jgi:hypothetical protein